MTDVSAGPVPTPPLDPAAPRPLHYAPPQGWTRVLLTVAWDGSAYGGWQSQPNAPSVQDTLHAALNRLGLEAARPVAAGRTDAGVHALNMPAHVDLHAPRIPPERLALALARQLPRSVAVLSAQAAPAGFHARFSCTQRRYLYQILNAPARHPLEEGRSLWVRGQLDLSAMNAAAQHLIGLHDFAAFATKEDRQTVRELQRLAVTASPLPYGQRVTLAVVGESFLRHMVRGLVGTLIAVGQGKLAPEAVAEILASGDRRQAGINVAPDGLYFAGAGYAGFPELSLTAPPQPPVAP
ncbi:tRNA pseudouridine synthase A [Deinococcus proteolyticus MRP]|uniref:tRNA pseudouridine synthase A n=1 Tax=Deinococcus proteolyticus (strain ATCC 35074 / DSM 20540 / JCM 6276 / NBRC 101906 / NCIMB 13154 / VKM Ac-1939 / CCM 2703 / MRP) TaxID=693977 RepID=F0RK88_DEIPM|nr:tRNA pseudouridine(38-40) synthase TruA [Deinococcus proteolyticus]ADY25647.1 tRNA pseudouridine synthase A [Deinococcus proteolyticus MRP]